MRQQPRIVAIHRATSASFQDKRRGDAREAGSSREATFDGTKQTKNKKAETDPRGCGEWPRHENQARLGFSIPFSARADNLSMTNAATSGSPPFLRACHALGFGIGGTTLPGPGGTGGVITGAGSAGTGVEGAGVAGTGLGATGVTASEGVELGTGGACSLPIPP
jgi:hypothetical protein